MTEAAGPIAGRDRIAELERELRQLKLARLSNGPAAGAAGAVTVVVLHASGRRFAVPVDRVQQVVPMPLVQPMPGAPPAVRGQVNVRGQLVPVIDVAGTLKETSGPLRPEGYLVLLQAGERRFALAAREIERVMDVRSSELSSAYVPQQAPLAGCVVPATSGALFLLDVVALLDAAELGTTLAPTSQPTGGKP